MALFRSLSALSRRNVQQQKSSPLTLFRWIQMQTSSQDTDLRSQLKELIPEQQEQLKKLKAEHGKVQLGNITLDMVLGGMRGMIGLLWETSLLDPEEAKSPVLDIFELILCYLSQLGVIGFLGNSFSGSFNSRNARSYYQLQNLGESHSPRVFYGFF